MLTATGCDFGYPEVVIVNRTAEHVLIKNPSFNGCVWNVVLAFDDTTPPGRCLPGKDQVHFQKLDVTAYCTEQACGDGGFTFSECEEDRASEISDAAVSDTWTDADADDAVDAEVSVDAPTWFNYQTLSTKRVTYGDFRVFEITLDDIEQDFSVPGPYGH